MRPYEETGGVHFVGADAYIGPKPPKAGLFGGGTLATRACSIVLTVQKARLATPLGAASLALIRLLHAPFGRHTPTGSACFCRAFSSAEAA